MIRRLRAGRRGSVFAAALVLLVGGLLNVGTTPANAHNWGNWHWNKGGTFIQIQSWIYGGTTAQAEAARVDAWNKVAILYNYRVDYHTDVSVFDANSGNTGWVGLASLESVSGDHILHGHAQYNTYYGYSSWNIQGVYCQEVYHTYGFDHDNTGGCMGLGYYAGSGNALSSHNVSDFDARYRYHTVS